MPSTTYHHAVNGGASGTASRRNSAVSAKRRGTREVRFGAYVLGATLGEGEFGKVKLGWRKDGQQPSQAAIKLMRRDSIPHGSEKENKIHREINALKRLRHPNIVRLVEVLQNEKYIGIVLEYSSGGELFDYILEHRYLKESMACRLFAQLVSGVDYMHSKGLVHRDLKLENLLLDKHKNIIISDFGFVNSFHPSTGSEMMRTSCGSPCYAAPELVVSNEPYQGTKVDVWSCGVILYAMLAGYLPYDDDPQNPDGENIARLYQYITKTPLTFPEYIQPTPRDLLRKIIVTDPHKRINLKQVRSHQWLAPHAPFLSVTPNEWDRNYKAARVLLTQSSAADKAHRRYSLMEMGGSAGTSTGSASLLSRNSIKRYASSSQQNPQSLYSHPAAPKTSRTVAISGSSSDIPSLAAVEAYRTFDTHHRSGSSASLALQAVVEADNKEHSRRNSVTELSLASASVTSSSGGLTSSSGSGGMSVLQRPEKRPFPRPLTLANVASESTPSFVPLDTLIGSNLPSLNQRDERVTGTVQMRAARASRRPRPTSYAPGMGSMGDIFERSSHSSRSTSPAKSTHSNKRGSWGQGKISEPALDMSMVSGVLTRLNEASETGNVEKRRSIALDSLSALEVGEKVTEEAEEAKEAAADAEAEAAPKEATNEATEETIVDAKPETTNIENRAETEAESKEAEVEAETKPAEEPVEELVQTTPEPVNATVPSIPAPKAAEAAPASPTTLVEDDNVVTPVSAPSEPVVEQAEPVKVASDKENETVARNQSQRSHHSQRSQHSGVSSSGNSGSNLTRTHTTNSEKENRAISSVTNKFKRFSLLSFYSKDTISETAPSTVRPATRESQNTSTRHVSPQSRRVSSNRKPLEPSNQQPLQQTSQKQRQASQQRQQQRQQQHQQRQQQPRPMGQHSSQKHATQKPGQQEQGQQEQGQPGQPGQQEGDRREQSTAKRVMDFFRRRSIRI